MPGVRPAGLTETDKVPGVLPEVGVTEIGQLPPEVGVADAVKLTGELPLAETARVCAAGSVPPVV